MRKCVLFVSVGLLAGAGVTAALACPCHLGRGVRLQRAYVAARPASVLIFLGGNRGKSGLANPELQSTLKQAGHKIEAVDDAARLEQDLKAGKFDLILVEYGDAAAVAERVKADAAGAMIVPVMGKASKAEVAAATRQFAYVVKSSGDPLAYLVAIDQAMKSRPLAKS